MLNEWSNGRPLPGSINEAMNADYPYVLTDGITIYYASDGPGSMGGYDIFVTRYNTNTDTYLYRKMWACRSIRPTTTICTSLTNSTTWDGLPPTATSPKDKVCIYVFIPNSSKQVYNYEAMDPQTNDSLAQIHC